MVSLEEDCQNGANKLLVEDTSQSRGLNPTITEPLETRGLFFKS